MMFITRKRHDKEMMELRNEMKRFEEQISNAVSEFSDEYSRLKKYVSKVERNPVFLVENEFVYRERGSSYELTVLYILKNGRECKILIEGIASYGSLKNNLTIKSVNDNDYVILNDKNETRYFLVDYFLNKLVEIKKEEISCL